MSIMVCCRTHVMRSGRVCWKARLLTYGSKCSLRGKDVAYFRSRDSLNQVRAWARRSGKCGAGPCAAGQRTREALGLPAGGDADPSADDATPHGLGACDRA